MNKSIPNENPDSFGRWGLLHWPLNRRSVMRTIEKVSVLVGMGLFIWGMVSAILGH